MLQGGVHVRHVEVELDPSGKGRGAAEGQAPSSRCEDICIALLVPGWTWRGPGSPGKTLTSWSLAKAGRPALLGKACEGVGMCSKSGQGGWRD